MWAELIWALPFVFLLIAIAVLPLVQKHWWEKNFPLVSFSLAAVVTFHYFFLAQNTQILLHTAHEYFSFICLIGALFVVAGGIHINVKGEATPFFNSVFLLVGAVLANVLGTTGASMILIRPWIRMNKYRFTAYHVVFFIFLVSNIGGGLTPIGDPPLFLGYLRGVPFFWVFREVWTIWIMTIAVLLAVFFVIDTLNFQKSPKAIREKKTNKEEWRFVGKRNLFFLGMILAAVFVDNPPFLRETIMILAAVLSYQITPKSIHQSNDFQFGPIKEVAILFFGIFATMIPALEWLEKYAPALGITSVGQFFWGSGVLSSVLDNAPTYLNFLSAAIGLFVPGAHADKTGVALLLMEHAPYVRAISVASVFFGAVTYIGNGPNFLVKSIVDGSQVKTPSFFGYFFKYSLPILIPIFTLVWFIFFRV